MKIRKGSHIYELGDHGGLIVLADDQSPTNQIIYSWDEGLTWQELRFSEEKMIVKNIIIEPTSTSQNFIVYGETQSKKGKTKGFTVGLDFSSLHKPECRNPDTPDTDSSDYETWSPSDGWLGHHCLLGIKSIYIRRKREAACFNSQQYERNKILEFCHCTEEDYECDLGFERLEIKGPCTAIGGINETERIKPPENCKGFYNVSKGYRKVPGNQCKLGVSYDPMIFSCSFTEFSYLSILLFLFFISILILLIYNFSNTLSLLPLLLMGYVKNITENKSIETIKNRNDTKYKNVENTLFFPEEDDNVLFEDREDQHVDTKQSCFTDKKEFEKNKNVPMDLIKNKISIKVPPINKKNSVN